MRAGHVMGFLQLAEALRQLGSFGLQLFGECDGYMLVKRPQLIYGQGFQVVASHDPPFEFSSNSGFVIHAGISSSYNLNQSV